MIAVILITSISEDDDNDDDDGGEDRTVTFRGIAMGSTNWIDTSIVAAKR